MNELFLNNIYLILLIPLWTFLIIMLGRFFSVYINNKVIYVLTFLSSILGITICSGALWKYPIDKILELDFPFIKINNFSINYGLLVDKTSLIFALVLFLVAFGVQLFSIPFFNKEKKLYRFYALLNFFSFSMAGLLFSPNLFQTYFFWELIGIVSYLLIGFDYFKIQKSISSRKVFIINRIGDTALIGAIIICSYLMYSYAPNKTLSTLSYIDINVISTLLYAYTSESLFIFICTLFIIGFLVKSAQFPFYTWLQDAMEAKLPVSALLHSATLVAAGLFVALRIYPILTFEPMIIKQISILGLITALLCSISATAQINPKKVLAYSTSAQFGLMYFALGLGNIKALLILFITHAFIKPLLFITLPKYNEKWNFISFIVFLVSALSLSGIMLSGLIAKGMLSTGLNQTYTIIISLISFLTTFYLIRIAFVLYDKHSIEKNKLSNFELLAFLTFLILNISFYIFLHFIANYHIAESFWASITAWIFAYILYIKKAYWKIPIIYSLAYNGFYIDNFYTKFCTKIYSYFTNCFNYIDNNIFTNYYLTIETLKKIVKTVNFIENKIMNGTITFIGKLFKKISLLDSKLQTSNIQAYNTSAFLIITIVIICLIFSYTFIINYIKGGF